MSKPKQDRPIYSAVFGTYGQFNVVCTIRQSGKVFIAGKETEFKFPFDGTAFSAFAQGAVEKITKRRDLPIADEHTYQHNLSIKVGNNV